VTTKKKRVSSSADAEGPLKSSFELAMERLRAQDRAEGTEEPAPLTADQKETIAGLRRRAKAKLAELEILHAKTVASAGPEPEKLAQIEERYQIDRRRVESALESAVARVRRGESADFED
jgi:hypothetical protein